MSYNPYTLKAIGLIPSNEAYKLIKAYYKGPRGTLTPVRFTEDMVQKSVVLFIGGRYDYVYLEGYMYVTTRDGLFSKLIPRGDV